MPETLLRSMGSALGWLKARERRVLLITAAAQLLILVAMIGLRALPLLTGQTVLVRVEPVDPRDLFRGDYVILSYDFSRVPPQEIEGLPETWRGKRARWEDRTIYVPLVQDADRVHWKAGKVTAVKPDIFQGAGIERVQFPQCCRVSPGVSQPMKAGFEHGSHCRQDWRSPARILSIRFSSNGTWRRRLSLARSRWPSISGI